MYVYVYVPVNTGTWESQKKMLDPLRVELQAAIKCPMWLQRIKLFFEKQYVLLTVELSFQPLQFYM